jgi:hypothetical protein
MGVGPGGTLAAERWLHIRVVEREAGGERVKLDLPLETLPGLLPLIQIDELRGGSIGVEDLHLDGIDLNAILRALHDSADEEFISVKGPDEEIRVAKENGFLLVRVEHRGEPERVRVRLPMEVVDALVSNEPGRLDLAAAVEALGRSAAADLVTVESPEGTVRVWVDGTRSGTAKD